jgi:hypothetical protein
MVVILEAAEVKVLINYFFTIKYMYHTPDENRSKF